MRAAPSTVADLPHCRLGEGPWWDVETACLYWVDISGHRIHRWWPASGQCETHEVGTFVGFVMLDETGRIVAGVRDGIYALDFGTPHRRLLARPDMHPETRFNDAACDSRGRLWAGTMHISGDRDKVFGALYRLTPTGLELVERDIGIANGLGWSPDGATMYFADTHRGIVWGYEYDVESGRAGPRRVFAEVPVDVGVPDGLSVDSAGRVFVAIWRGARLNVYAPDGSLDAVIEMPVPHATSCCFGGADLRTLYITTMADGLTAEQLARCPLSGRLFAMDVDVPGLPSPRVQTPADGDVTLPPAFPRGTGTSAAPRTDD